MVHPEYRRVTERSEAVEDTLTPLYPLTEGVTQGRLRMLIAQALRELDSAGVHDWLPRELLDDLHLPPLREALQKVVRDSAAGLAQRHQIHRQGAQSAEPRERAERAHAEKERADKERAERLARTKAEEKARAVAILEGKQAEKDKDKAAEAASEVKASAQESTERVKEEAPTSSSTGDGFTSGPRV